MKYIKIYESFNQKNLFFDLCNQYLPFLLDDGFEIFNDIDNSILFTVILCKPGYGLDEYTYDYLDFTWNDVRNDFIPFVEILKIKGFNILKIRIDYGKQSYDITNNLEEFQTNESILSIFLVIKK
jgi:hypothetical protein